MRTRSLPVWAVLAAIGLLSLSACDTFDSGTSPAQITQDGPTGKLRHANLLPEASSGKFGADSVQLIIGYDPIYGAQRVVRTYRVFRTYRVVRRYEFGDVLDGEAITVGVEEMQALLDSLENDPAVAWVEPDFDVPVGEISTEFWWEKDQKKSWGIGPSKADKSFFQAGDNKDEKGVPDVDLYILDSGAESPDLNVVECLEFRSEAFVPCQRNTDYLGHGTAVAGVAAARDNKMGLVGTAPGAPLHIIRTLNAAGYSNESRMVKAIAFVTERKLANPARPVVMNLSFGAYVGTTTFTAMDEAVQAAIAAGVTVVVSAGNEGADAGLFSPAHVPDAITVGAYNKDKKFSWFSNHGAVVDLLAPGDRLEVLFAGSDPNKLMRESGTSFAAPHVAGAAAVLLARNPSLTPQQVRDRLVQMALADGEKIADAPRGTVNRALYMDKLGEKP